MPYHSSVHSELSRAWTTDPLSVHSIISRGWVIAYILFYWTFWLEKTAARLWLNSIHTCYTKPVTCSKGRKVPFAVTRYIYVCRIRSAEVKWSVLLIASWEKHQFLFIGPNIWEQKKGWKFSYILRRKGNEVNVKLKALQWLHNTSFTGVDPEISNGGGTKTF